MAFHYIIVIVFDDIISKYNIERIYVNRCINSDAIKSLSHNRMINYKLLTTISLILEIDKQEVKFIW